MKNAGNDLPLPARFSIVLVGPTPTFDIEPKRKPFGNFPKGFCLVVYVLFIVLIFNFLIKLQEP